MRTIGLLLALTMAAGCTRRAPAPMEDETFVTVMVELRRGLVAGQDSAAYQAARDEVLNRAGVTEADLHAYVRWAARRPDHLRETFDEITRRLRDTGEGEGL